MNSYFFGGLVSELEKMCSVVTPLQPHQQRVVDKIMKEDQPGLVVAHGLGSGKTLTSIAAQDSLGIPADVVVPAALQENYLKELKKHHTTVPKDINIKSLQNMAVKRESPTSPLMVVDEAHRLRDPSSVAYSVIKGNKASKRLLLTGSPIYNHPSDVSQLVNLASGSKLLPTTKSEFEQEYVSNIAPEPGFIDRLRGLKRGYVPGVRKDKSERLRSVLNKWVDYHKGSTTDFPSVKREDVQVEMTPEQLKVYDSLMGNAPFWVQHKVRKGLPPSKQEASELNSFLSGVRQVSNSTAPFAPSNPQLPKIHRAYEELKKTIDSNPKAKAVIYSNFLEAGLDPYKKLLDEGKVPYGEFSGRLSKTERDALVRDYNEGKLKALLLSSAGGEGLDLKNTRLLQILEPHWNDEKLHQVEGRGIRFKSHSELPEPERDVRVQRFMATRPKAGLLERLGLKNKGFGVDEYLYEMSKNKSKLNDQFKALMEQDGR